MTLSPADHAIRSQRIGSTRAVKIALGQAHEVWRELNGLEPAVEETEAMAIGTAVEPVIREMAAKRLHVQVKKPPTIVHPDPKYSDWVCDSIDGVFYVEDNPEDPFSGLECKAHGFGVSAQYGETSDDDPTDEVPEKVYLQCVHHMWVHGLPSCYVAPLMGGFTLQIPLYRIPHDADTEAALVYKLEQFHHDHMVRGEEPPLDGFDSTTEYLKNKYPYVKKDIRDADKNVEDWAEELRQVRADLTRMELRKDALANRIKNWIGESDGVTGSFGKISWNEIRGRAKTDWRNLALSMGATKADAEKYTTIGKGYRRFTVPRDW